MQVLNDDLILSISKNLSLKDILRLSETSKRFRDIIMSPKGIQYYSYHHNFVIFIPRVQNFAFSSLYEGYYYFEKAQKLSTEISALEKELQVQFSAEAAQFALAGIFSINALTPTKMASLDKLTSEYDSLLQKAINKNNLCALLVKIADKIETHSNEDDLPSCKKKLNEIKIELDPLKSLYGDYVDLFLVHLYCKYANGLLQRKNREIQAIGDETTRQTLGVDSRSVEEIESICIEQVTFITTEAQTILSTFGANFKLDHYTRRNIGMIFDIKIKGATEKTIVDMLSTYITELENAPCEQLSLVG
ncbi:F-box protein [Legionella hackeliae]|uniref:F-box domain-containing protein n=1 Tax=Legionella hackeliae TaxID=449 RepID=A0A0A8UTH5_LEGHA|nr:F-box protein [Legionella hackeliae]KTD12617.1 hypothetical protein Lhac_1488 [Legionella hackeliae]CEK12033.1 protein of unknown function [F-box domain] [Legionella hackeliae]STX48818.1 Uncharacterised protein [Legionella hackeliae]